ncbi:MAG: FtsX-like permease family protein [Clostridia bacterium]
MIKNALARKLMRDFSRNKLQFLSMLLLCALGSWVFSGLDAAWRQVDLSVETYYQQQDLADFWVELPSADANALRSIRHLDGVADAQLRVKVELDVDGAEKTSLLVYGYDENPRINRPLLLEGALPKAQDGRALLLDASFAKANGIAVGQTLTLTLDEYAYQKRFTVCGLIATPEQVITSRDVSPDPLHFGFAVASNVALEPFTPSEIILKLTPNGDAAAVRAWIEERYPSAFLLDQQANATVQRARDDVSMFRNLSYVFPLLAFAVAAMIVLTTITRMIENQRTQLGTLKALGYNSHRIRNHYLSYAIYPSVLGSLLGLFAGRMTLPGLLWSFEASTYVLPLKLVAPISPQAWFVCGLGVLLACGVGLFIYRKSSAETAASLLRPKPPKIGKRNLLERIPALWRRMGFNSKMICRNMFRNKLRTLMTLMGIICCNMLLITTFGLQDSMSYFVGKYYQGTIAYDLRVDLNSQGGTLESYRKRLDAARVDGLMEMGVSMMGAKTMRSTSLMVLCDDQQSFRLGNHYAHVQMPASGVGMTQKLMQTLGVREGDSVRVLLSGDDEPLTLTVTQTLYSNIGQGAYMSQTAWEELRRGEFRPSALLLNAPTAECQRLVRDMDEQSAVKDPRDQYTQNLAILSSVTSIFTVMAGAALGLAFVITYNMGILNFAERLREYATLKVLGYHQKEIRHLIMRESILVALLGTLVGIGPGIWLTRIIMVSCETEQLVYGVHVTVPSIVIASVITFGFACLVQLLLTRKVRRIDMVESLKSVE